MRVGLSFSSDYMHSYDEGCCERTMFTVVCRAGLLSLCYIYLSVLFLFSSVNLYGIISRGVL